MGAASEESSADGPNAARSCAGQPVAASVGIPPLRGARFRLTLALALLAVAGCTRGPAQELAGQWVGRPDSAAVRAARNAERFGTPAPPEGVAAAGDAPEVPPSGSQPTSRSAAETGRLASEGGASEGGAGAGGGSVGGMGPAATTDWQQYQVEVRLGFDPRGAASLQLDKGPTVVAQWEIVEAGPAGWVLELATPAAEGDAAGEVVRRRFELLTDRRGPELVGFTLTEVGADRQLGALYFQRAQ